MSNVKLLCQPCDFSTMNFRELQLHKMSENHLKNVRVKNVRVNVDLRCDFCGFETKNKSIFDQHAKKCRPRKNILLP